MMIIMTRLYLIRDIFAKDVNIGWCNSVKRNKLDNHRLNHQTDSVTQMNALSETYQQYIRYLPIYWPR